MDKQHSGIFLLLLLHKLEIRADLRTAIKNQEDIQSQRCKVPLHLHKTLVSIMLDTA